MNDSVPDRIYTVSRLNLETRQLLAEHFSTIIVEGEISNLASPSSGHIYFSLKDADAQIRCAMFRSSRRFLEFRPENGLQVRLTAQVSLYEARGEYQLIVSRMEEAGSGALQQAFERLKSKLAGEGLFDPERKRVIPGFPARIGVITSPTGAAIRDILSVLQRRFPLIPVTVFPVTVQGPGAAAEIVDALDRAGAATSPDCEVLVIARGGGSLEDLQAFNEEPVARAIARCNIPIVSGIGHETDFTIADFVADLRAPTPSAAAEAITPDQQEWLARIEHLQKSLLQKMRASLTRRTQLLQWVDKRLEQLHPGRNLHNQAQRLDDLEIRLKRAITVNCERSAARVSATAAHLSRHNPQHRLQMLDSLCDRFRQRLHAGMRILISRQDKRFRELARALETVSPLATLSRGYAVVSEDASGTILRSAQQTRPGEKVTARLSTGKLLCEVKHVIDG